MPDVKKLRQLAAICGVKPAKAAARAGIGRRTYQTWFYNDVKPSPDLYERMWNAVIDEARDAGRLSTTVVDRCQKELGVSL